ncbi:MAG: DUF805 domain-containing protein [Acidobacteria bacterium]|nr:DUF805 domain-containing protein [Acidobacteriota bacterium]MCB9396558.1 DUF805 domain-containing protein [Acidobacteriota bacterium]
MNQQEAPEEGKVVFWQWDRRMGRLPFLVLTVGMGMFLVSRSIQLFHSVPFIGVLVGCAWLILMMTCCAQRLHDMGLRAGYLFIGFFPLWAWLGPAMGLPIDINFSFSPWPIKVLGWIWYAVLLLKPGQTQPNAWGDPPAPTGRSWIAAGVLCALLLCIFLISPLLPEKWGLGSWL